MLAWSTMAYQMRQYRRYLAARPPHTHGPVTVFELTDMNGVVLLLAHDRDADTMRAELWTTRDGGLVLDRFDPPLSADASGALPRGRHEIIVAYRRWIDHLAG